MSIEDITLTFGAWVERQREEQDLRLHILSEKSKIYASTISRIERQKTQATLLTAMQISQGLGRSLLDYVAAAYPPQQRQHLAVENANLDEPEGSLQQSNLEPHAPTLTDQSHKRSTVISGQDIRMYLTLYEKDPEVGQELLCNWLNRILGQLNRNMAIPLKPCQTDDIVRLLNESSLYHFELKYPSQIKQQTIIGFWQKGGVMMPEDVDNLIKKIAQDYEFVWGLTGKPRDALRRLCTTSFSGVKLDDVIELDQKLGVNLLEMFWAAAQFSEWRVSEIPEEDRVAPETIHWTKDQSRLVHIFMIISRWLTHLENGSTAWLEQMRNEIIHYSTLRLS